MEAKSATTFKLRQSAGACFTALSSFELVRGGSANPTAYFHLKTPPRFFRQTEFIKLHSEWKVDAWSWIEMFFLDLNTFQVKISLLHVVDAPLFKKLRLSGKLL